MATMHYVYHNFQKIFPPTSHGARLAGSRSIAARPTLIEHAWNETAAFSWPFPAVEVEKKALLYPSRRSSQKGLEEEEDKKARFSLGKVSLFELYAYLMPLLTRPGEEATFCSS